MLFTRNKIKGSEETVAVRLRRARLEKNLSLEAAAKKLAISADYLRALESGDYQQLPRGVYGKTYLKKYGAWLGLDWGPLEKAYNRELGPSAGKKSDVFDKKRVNPLELLIFPRILRNILVIIFLAALFLYLGFYLKNGFSEPKLAISSPPDNLTTESSTIEIIGQTSPPTQIFINGKQIFKDETGNFREPVNLKKGLNSITIIAKNKYSRGKTIIKQILVK